MAEETGSADGLDISGSVRPRYETVSNPLRAGAAGTEDLLSVRSTLQIEGRWEDVSAVAEGLDSRRIAGDDNPDAGAPSQLNAAELLQAYAAWSPDDVFQTGDRLRIAAGRMTLDLGGRRLVARSAMSGVPTAFDGLDASWTAASGFTLRALSVRPVSRRPTDDESLLDNEIALDSRPANLRLSALWGSLPAPGGLAAELGVYRLEENEESDSPARTSRLTTWSARLHRDSRPSGFDVDIEYARQTGDVRTGTGAAEVASLSKDAHMLHAEAGYTLGSSLARISIHYDRATGDANPADAEDNRFHPLFGDRSFELGPTAAFGAVARANLDSAAVRIEATPPGPWDGLLSLRSVRLESETDSLGGSGLRDTSGGAGSHAGEQIEWRIRRWLVKDVARLAVGGALFLRGGFLDDVPGAPAGDPAYTYADITWTF